MFERYLSQTQLPQIGQIGQQKLQQAKVICVGAGGLGSSCLQYLVAAGVGHIGICDGDTVSLSNLQRQVLYREMDIDQMKSTVAIKHLQQNNSSIIFHNIPFYLTSENALALLSSYDYVIDATDNFKSKLLLNDACHRLAKPLISASVQQFQGHCSVYWASFGPCMRCIFEELDKAHGANCSQAGVLGVVPAIFGILQALEVIKLCLGWTTALIGQLWCWDLLGASPRVYAFERNPDCLLCTGQASFDTLWPTQTSKGVIMQANQISIQELIERVQANEEIFLLDVRNQDEYEAFNLGGYLLPLAELAERITELPRDKSIVVHCHSGQRSQLALEFLQAAGFTDVSNLTGGVMAWHQMSHSCEHC